MIRWLSVLVLLAANGVLWSIPLPQGLTVSFLDIGQGDSVLIQGPTGAKLLVDGGPDSSVLREMGSVLPFWDKEINAVLATHPDQDHIGGLPDILRRYDVRYVFEPGIQNTTRAWNSFVNATNDELKSGAEHVVLRSGTRLLLGGGAYADVLYPDHDVSHIKETNAGSIVLRVVHGKTAFMLTGDLPSKEEQELYLKYGYGLDSDVLKAGHHGSRTSSSADFVQSVSPAYVVFSRGCDNTYGHPHQEVIRLFTSLGVSMLDTCTSGRVTFRSDGTTLQSF
jgi:competence protein ComEC